MRGKKYESGNARGNGNPQVAGFPTSHRAATSPPILGSERAGLSGRPEMGKANIMIDIMLGVMFLGFCIGLFFVSILLPIIITYKIFKRKGIVNANGKRENGIREIKQYNRSDGSNR